MGLYNPYRTRKIQGLWVCIILIGLGKPKVCVNLFGIGEPIKLLFKGGGKKKNLTQERFIRFFFETLASSYRRKSSCYVSCTPLVPITKQSLLHQH